MDSTSFERSLEGGNSGHSNEPISESRRNPSTANLGTIGAGHGTIPQNSSSNVDGDNRTRDASSHENMTMPTSTSSSQTDSAHPSASAVPVPQGTEDWTEQLSNQFEDIIGKPSREAIHDFFYPQRNDIDHTSNHEMPRESIRRTEVYPNNRDTHRVFDQHFEQQAEDDRQFVHRFWTTYDDILMLCLFSQLGICFRLASSTWLKAFDSVFSKDSPLFTNLPLNCLSCFILGLLSPGERLMEIISTRFSPPRLQQYILSEGVPGDIEQLGRRRSTSSESSQEDKSQDENNNYPTHSGRQQPSLNPEDVNTSQSLHNSPVSRGMLRRRRRRRAKKQKYFHSWDPPLHLNDELRDVQLLALERRIRASKCLVLFPVRKEDVDVMEHYFQEGYQRQRWRRRNERESYLENNIVDVSGIGSSASLDDDNDSTNMATRGFSFDLELKEELAEEGDRRKNVQITPTTVNTLSPSSSDNRAHPSQMADKITGESLPRSPVKPSLEEVNFENVPQNQGVSSTIANSTQTLENDEQQEDNSQSTQYQVDQLFTDVKANVTENIYRLHRINIADGWDAGTTPEAMSDDIMLGLRDGFCGALSSFSSWSSAMVNFLRRGEVGKAVVGYMLGIQLPIISYRFGQHIAVYIFVWRCRFENKLDERRGYGIQVAMNDRSEGGTGIFDEECQNPHRRKREDEIPSIRAVFTALFIIAVVTQCTSLSFFSEPQHQQIALSLLFSPLGTFARWRLSRLNSWRPSFPLGTFTSNMLACSLSGGLGTLLAGNPGPRERIALVSFIAGFAGTLSSVATFIVEILAGVDPILFRFDGFIYAALSIFWAMVIGFLFSTSADWADETA